MFTSKAGYLNSKLSIKVQISRSWCPFLSSFHFSIFNFKEVRSPYLVLKDTESLFISVVFIFILSKIGSLDSTFIEYIF